MPGAEGRGGGGGGAVAVVVESAPPAGDAASALTAICPSPLHGRGLFFTGAARLPPGGIALIDAPLAAVIPPEAAAKRCRACLAPLSAKARSAVPPCPGCGSARWCDAACRADDATHAASGECALLQADAGVVKGAALGPELLRDACLALRLLAAGGPAERLESGRATSEAPTPRDRAAAGAVAAAAAVGTASSGSPATIVTPDAAAAALRAAALNAVELDAAPLDAGGGPADNARPAPPLALYATACAINHSCRPNVCFAPRARGRLAVRALREVAPGEELLAAYVDPVAPRAERRTALRAGWGFACACDRCAQPLDARPAPADAWLGHLTPGSIAAPASVQLLDCTLASLPTPGQAPGAALDAAARVGAAALAALSSGVGPAHAAVVRCHLVLPGLASACAADALAHPDEGVGFPGGRDAAAAAGAAGASAILSAAVPALAGEAAIAGGETGALLFASRAWNCLATRLLWQAAAEVNSACVGGDWAGGLRGAGARTGEADPPPDARQPAVGPPLPPTLPRTLLPGLAAARAGVEARRGAAPAPLEAVDASLALLLPMQHAALAASAWPAADPPPCHARWAAYAALASAAAARAADLASLCLGEGGGSGTEADAAAFAAMHYNARALGGADLPPGLRAAIVEATAGARAWGPDRLVG